MATLTVDKPRNYTARADAYLDDLPVVASDIIYEGAAVGSSSGLARPLVAGDNFLGFAVRQVDNSAGAASAKRVCLKTKGDVELAVTGVSSAGNHGATVYASDDDTFTLSSTGNSAIGKVKRWISSTTCMVSFEGVQERSL